MRVLFVATDRHLSSVAFGGSGVVYAGLLEMLRSRGDLVYVVLLRDATRSGRYEDWKAHDPGGAAELASWIAGIEIVEYRLPPRTSLARRTILALGDPQRRAYPFLDSGVRDRVVDVADRAKPDLVIAGDLVSGVVCSRSGLGVPITYYHQDFFWRIKALREGTIDRRDWRSAWGRRIYRRAEDRLLRNVDACITGSEAEVQMLRAAGARTVALVPPVVTGSLTPIPDAVPQPCRLVHLGGFGTTATRLGLESFLARVWPVVRERLSDVELWVVGNTAAADRAFLTAIEDAGAVVTGFVPDLTTVLRPGDLHVIPWAFETGVRTRVVSCFQHGQALVAVRAGVAGYEGLETDHHCVLVDTVDELVAPLVDLASEPSARLELARGGRNYLMNRLTVSAVRPRFDAVVRELTGPRRATAAGA